jgi:uncharacterized membrane protein
LAEIGLFFISVIGAVIYVWAILATGSSLFAKFSVLLVPTFLWVFMRVSRKDMNATAGLVAGLFGALGGAIAVIVAKMLG